jgi:flagellar biosynthetic protein FliR
VSTAITTEQLVGMLLVSIRVGTFLWIAPVLGGRLIPPRIRVGVAVAMAIPMTPMAVQASGPVPLGAGGLVWAALQQVVVGAALGLAVLGLISAVQSAGSLIDLFGGFSVSQAYDPMLMQQSSIMGRVYQLLGAALLLVTGAHLVILQGFANTFEVLPIDGSLDIQHAASTLTQVLTTMFVSALQIAGPLIGVSFLADVALGLMTRVAPSLNAFSLGFPLKIGLTLVLVALALPMLPPALLGLSQQAVDAMGSIAGGG